MPRIQLLLPLFDAALPPLIARANGSTVSRPDFLDRAVRQLNHLIAQGARHGDRIVIALDNREEYLELVLALALGGMVACPVPPDLPPQQLAKVRRLLDAKLTITAYNQLAYSLDSQMPECTRQGDADDPFLIVFSSGTTGAPKGIIQSLRNFIGSAASFATLTGMRPGDTVLHNWPMFYNAGLFNLFACPLIAGATIAIGKRFAARDMGEFWNDVGTFKPDWIYLSPTMASSLARTAKFFPQAKEGLGAARVVSTSSILYPSVRDEFRKVFAKGIIPCFGITELGGSFTFGDEESSSYSVGRTIPEVSVECDVAADGEFLVTTPFMALGYIKEGGLIETFARNTPFRTGDLGHLAAGEMIVSGRRKDSIKKGGEFIALSEIEDLANASGQCTECMAIGRPDAFWGEVYDIRFVPAAETAPHDAESALSALFNTTLPQVMRPESVKAVDALPKTASGKIIKQPVNYISRDSAGQ